MEGIVEDPFQHLEHHRFQELLSALSNTILKQVLKRMTKVLETGEVLLSPLTASQILKSLVYQGELEPYGVRGGTLVVLFRDRLGKLVKLGRFPLDKYTNSTYEMHLTLQENTNFKLKVENLMRRIAGLDPVLVLGSEFKLEKRKLYRSSTCSADSL